MRIGNFSKILNIFDAWRSSGDRFLLKITSKLQIWNSALKSGHQVWMESMKSNEHGEQNAFKMIENGQKSCKNHEKHHETIENSSRRVGEC